MAKELAETYPSLLDTFQEASGVLGYDVWNLCQEGPSEELNVTLRAQPVILTVSVAIYRLWRDEGGEAPAYMAGHSLGEYSALVCAGAMAFADALRLVEDRARYMQEAVPEGEGAMYAILGLADDAVEKLCRENTGERVVEPANYNAPGQVVISGHASAVELVSQAALEAGAKKCVPLSVSAPSHCSLMRPAGDRLAERLQEVSIAPLELPVVNNCDVASPTDPEAVKDALVRQLYSPVKWRQTATYLDQQGVSAACECGPGRVLAGLAKRIDRGLKVYTLERLADFEQAVKEFEE